MFFLVKIVKEKKMLSSTCDELAIISYFGKCEYDYCFNILQEHDNNILKECFILIGKNYFKKYFIHQC